jgi:chorismate mutase
MKMTGSPWGEPSDMATLLFDMQTDPDQLHPIHDPDQEALMLQHLIRLMKQNDVPAEQFVRLGLADA